ncbi:MAG: formate--tetrahydrofolate ligase [Acholeplasmataceae bacterium]
MTKYEYLTEVLKIDHNEIIRYGEDKFKINLSLLDRLKEREDGKLILVSAINPTSSGEGKTTISIGLGQGLKSLGKNVVIALREPSMGPVFGMKGGATGGGVSSLEPSIDIDLHFNGDLHAITSANNLLSALIDNHIYFGNELKIKEVYWQRALDVNDRSLRNIKTKLREDKFTITAASEMMAILALASSFSNLKERINDIIIGINEFNELIYVKELGGADAIALVLKDAIKPNIVFAKEMVPSFVHAGPFANIAHGCSSVLATEMALKLGDYVITEAGFGADLGMEKFLHIKMPHLKSKVKLVVVVATIKALKLHGGIKETELDKPDLTALEKGLENLKKHLENIQTFGLNSVVAINKFETDSTQEINYLNKWARDNNVEYGLSEAFTKGGKGAKNLAQIVIDNIDKKTNFKRIYENDDANDLKIKKIAKVIYGADDVLFSKKALKKLEQFKNLKFPICIAKTPLSLTGNPKIKGRPKGFILEIDDLKISHGAKLIVALTKGINLLPGLNKVPRLLSFKVDSKGELIS